MSSGIEKFFVDNFVVVKLRVYVEGVIVWFVIIVMFIIYFVVVFFSNRKEIIIKVIIIFSVVKCVVSDGS